MKGKQGTVRKQNRGNNPSLQDQELRPAVYLSILNKQKDGAGSNAT